MLLVHLHKYNLYAITQDKLLLYFIKDLPYTYLKKPIDPGYVGYTLHGKAYL